MNLLILLGALFIIIAVVLVAYRVVNKDKTGTRWIVLILIAGISFGAGISLSLHAMYEDGYQDGLGGPVRVLPVGEEYRVFFTQTINDEQYLLLVEENGRVVYYSPDTHIDVSYQDYLITVQTEKGLQLRTYT